MKRLLCVLAALPVVFVGCTSADPSDPAEETGSPISLRVSTADVQTRGEAMTSTNFAQDGRMFRLWAWMTDTETSGATATPMTSDFNSHALSGIDVTCSGGDWLPDGTYGTYYWPRPKYRMDCYAIFPHDAVEVAAFTADTKTITYTAENPFNGETDLMYATFTGQRPGRDNSEKSRAVSLRFHHAMAQVSFYGKLSSQYKAQGWTVEVQDITIYHVDGAGTFSLTSDPAALGPDAASAMTFTLNSVAAADRPVYTPAMNTGHLRITDTSVEKDASGADVALTSGVLMLMPQTLTPWDSETETTGTTAPVTDGGYMAVRLRAIDADGNYPLQADGSYVTVYSPFGSASLGGWQAGTAYKYTITFGAGTSVTAEITPWTQEAINPEKPLYPSN